MITGLKFNFANNVNNQNRIQNSNISSPLMSLRHDVFQKRSISQNSLAFGNLDVILKAIGENLAARQKRISFAPITDEHTASLFKTHAQALFDILDKVVTHVVIGEKEHDITLLNLLEIVDSSVHPESATTGGTNWLVLAPNLLNQKLMSGFKDEHASLSHLFDVSNQGSCLVQNNFDRLFQAIGRRASGNEYPHNWEEADSAVRERVQTSPFYFEHFGSNLMRIRLNQLGEEVLRMAREAGKSK